MRQVAFTTVARACGFASLAIFCVMIGLSYDPHTAFEAGGVLTILMAAVLIYKAQESQRKDHRRTEMWLYLPDDRRPPEAYAQWMSAAVLREAYLTFALYSAGFAVSFWAVTVVLGIFRA